MATCIRYAALLAVLFLLLSNPVLASDGVIEINQASALAGNPAIGDVTPGFPVTIGLSGSYKLTSNLDVTGLPIPADISVIIVSPPPFVSIDLNGFGLIGPAVCGDTCAPTGTGDGISVFNSGGLSVSNGFVTGMGDKGIVAGPGYILVERVVVSSNGGNGIEFADGVIKDSIVRRNGGDGIAGGNLAISGTTAAHNIGRGIFASGPVTIENCSVAAGASVPGVKLSSGSLFNSSVFAAGGGVPALDCEGTCTLGGNTFSNCVGAACIGGSGTEIQVPAGSNVCGAGLCPP